MKVQFWGPRGRAGCDPCALGGGAWAALWLLLRKYPRQPSRERTCWVGPEFPTVLQPLMRPSPEPVVMCLGWSHGYSRAGDM